MFDESLQQLESAFPYFCFIPAKNSLKILNLICPGVALALVVASAPAVAQMYSWKDPASGQRRFSTIAPPWYNRGEKVNGPRVTAIVGESVIDDTALPYEERLLLSGRSREYVDKLRLQKDHGLSAAQGANREAARTQGSDLHPADKTTTHARTVSNKGS